jgi:hypothetical protein
MAIVAFDNVLGEPVSYQKFDEIFGATPIVVIPPVFPFLVTRGTRTLITAQLAERVDLWRLSITTEDTVAASTCCSMIASATSWITVRRLARRPLTPVAFALVLMRRQPRVFAPGPIHRRFTLIHAQSAIGFNLMHFFESA